ncbi:hypothetical protein, conserved [Eimeria brunetti]|uniref:Uncharacterized protein n=1 Tax=Eimeria brunetti TaxID=51314 RepID=U6LNP7_9EIME|nr:hypothetical protein, conserved [Eimeria brunetti]
MYVVVRNLDRTGFWYKLTSPCGAEETIPGGKETIPGVGWTIPGAEETVPSAPEETVSLLVTSSFSLTDGTERRVYRARILAPKETNPYRAEQQQGPFSFAVLQQQRRTFLQLLYLDTIFPHRETPFRDSPPPTHTDAATAAAAGPAAAASSKSPHGALELQQQQQQQQQRQDRPAAAAAAAVERFAPFGAMAQRSVSFSSPLQLPGSPFVFLLDLLPQQLSQLKGQMIAAGRAQVSPHSPLTVVLLPPSRFAKAPQVYVQLRSNGAPAFGLTRLLEVTRHSFAVYIHPSHCGPQEGLTAPPFDELDWMAWLPIF